MNRRNFIKQAGVAGLFIAAPGIIRASSLDPWKVPEIEKPKQLFYSDIVRAGIPPENCEWQIECLTFDGSLYGYFDKEKTWREIVNYFS